MKFFVLLLVVCAATVYADVLSDDDELAWTTFKKETGKLFLSKGKEAKRRENFLANRDMVKELMEKREAGELKYEPKIYPHHDLSPEEFVDRFGGLDADNLPETRGAEIDFSAQLRQGVPSSWDSRTKGWIGPVKQQGNCNSCWAFSGLCCIEAGYAIKGTKGLDLSEQQMVDCAKKDCNPASPSLAIQYMEQNGGCTSESAYPYTGVASNCKVNGGAYKTTGRPNVAKTKDSIKAAIMQLGALQIAVDCQAWSVYGKGIFHQDQGRGINHGVNVIGWGVENGDEYWIIRNSWGTNFGENGYIRVGTGADGGYNLQYTWAYQA